MEAKGLSVGFVWEGNSFSVHLINTSAIGYQRVVMTRGGFCSMDDCLLELENDPADLGPLPRESTIELDAEEDWALDFVNWYHLDLYDEQGEVVGRYAFVVPKYGQLPGTEKKTLALVALPGKVIELTPRNN